MIFKDPILLCLLGKNDNKLWRNWSRIFSSNVQASFHFWNLKTMKIYARLVLKILYFLSKGINFIFFVKIMSMNSLFGLTKGASGHKQWCIRLIDLPISEIYPKYCNVRFDFCPLCPAEVEKGVEHGSIAPRRKWTEPFLAEGLWPSLPHLSRFLQKRLFIVLLQLDKCE